MKYEDAIIVGAGPCGLAAAISLKEIGKNPLVIEKGNIVNAIYNYPTHQTFLARVKSLKSAMFHSLQKTINQNEFKHSLTTGKW